MIKSSLGHSLSVTFGFILLVLFSCLTEVTHAREGRARAGGAAAARGQVLATASALEEQCKKDVPGLQTGARPSGSSSAAGASGRSNGADGSTSRGAVLSSACSISKNTLSEQPAPKANDANYCAFAARRAEECCNPDATACFVDQDVLGSDKLAQLSAQFRNSSARAPSSSTRSDPTGMLNTSVQNKDIAEKGHRVYAGLAGKCYGFTENCARACSTTANKSHKDKCAASRGQLSNLLGQSENLHIQSLRSQDVANAVTGSGPNRNNSGSGINPSSLMQLAGPLMQALQQGDQEDSEAYADQEEQPFLDCSTNPNLAGCPVATDPPPDITREDGNYRLQDGTDANAGGFNLDDAGLMGDIPLNASAGSGQGATTGGVAGGGGGGGALGGGGAGASLGAQGGPVQGGSATPKVEFQGERGGGGYSQMAAMPMQTGGGGASGYVPPLEQGKDNLNLAAFLPGGERDPTRSLAGASGPNLQIQSKEVNIWNRISERYKSRCSQGLLKDCVP